MDQASSKDVDFNVLVDESKNGKVKKLKKMIRAKEEIIKDKITVLEKQQDIFLKREKENFIKIKNQIDEIKSLKQLVERITLDCEKQV